MNRYRRKLPRDVARKLRQEAGFGCASCGHPYLEYHHIIPYSEEEHFRPEDMVALCPNCHAQIGSQGRDRQYRLKETPRNVLRGEFRGSLNFDQRHLLFKIGNIWYENTPIILQFRDIPLISCRVESDQVLISLRLFNSAGRLVFQISDNEVVFRMGSLWDYEHSLRVVTVRSEARDIALKLDFRTSEAAIEGKLWAGDTLVKLSKDGTNLAGMSVGAGRIVNERVGIFLAG